MLTPHDLSESIVEWYRSIEHMFIGLSEYRSFIVRLSDITIGLSSRGSGARWVRWPGTVPAARDISAASSLVRCVSWGPQAKPGAELFDPT